jgi:DNA-binding MarR family transcriptional regulator
MTAAGVLDTVDRRGPRRITELAASEGITQPSMTALVTGLERAGLVSRQTDPNDLRVVLVVLTPTGRKYLIRRRDRLAAHFAEWIDQLSNEEFEALRNAQSALTHLWELASERTDEC